MPVTLKQVRAAREEANAIMTELKAARELRDKLEAEHSKAEKLCDTLSGRYNVKRNQLEELGRKFAIDEGEGDSTPKLMLPEPDPKDKDEIVGETIVALIGNNEYASTTCACRLNTEAGYISRCYGHQELDAWLYPDGMFRKTPYATAIPDPNPTIKKQPPDPVNPNSITGEIIQQNWDKTMKGFDEYESWKNIGSNDGGYPGYAGDPP